MTTLRSTATKDRTADSTSSSPPPPTKRRETGSGSHSEAVAPTARGDDHQSIGRTRGSFSLYLLPEWQL